MNTPPNNFDNFEYEDYSSYNRPVQPRRSSGGKNPGGNNKKIIIYVVLMAVLLLILIPLCMAACNAFKSSDNFSSTDDKSSASISDSSELSSFVIGGLDSEDPLTGLSSDSSSSDSPSSGSSAPGSSSDQSSSKASSSSGKTDYGSNPNVTNRIGKYQSGEKSELLQLVNFYNRLPSDYEPEITTIDGGKSFSVLGADALERMIADCNKACGGTKLWAQSTYRSYQKQTKLYNNEVNRWIERGMSQAEAEEKASTIVAIPGTSEHNTGLCCDFNTITEEFADTKMYDWLIEHCHEYGFVERYPKSKQDITGIIWEPWHYRYVGVEAATEMKEKDWCLEEYHYYKGL